MDTDNIAKEMSAKKVIRKHISSDFDKESVDAKLKANFNDGKIKQNISVNLKMIKDEVIWLKGTKFINVFKAKITPTSVKFYSPIAKVYFDGNFELLKDLLGVDINFNQLQNLFLGQSLINLKEDKQNIDIENNSYVLSPENQQQLFDIFFFINPSHFKLDKQSVVNSLKEQRLDILYSSYNFIDNVYFPSEIKIIAKEPKKVTNIDFVLKSVEFNTDVDVSFSIPKGYKQIKL
ncbi:DUF4292 domain-containing protein [Polaribacter sargassicola]|uniref:DUF4292 domain-containing protein n=1 Tax=Polaribacter sargassicola TaxID=2836891 RepID=UPI001F45D32E|nr:DUF4292 domain-containing protein [Polaribacter sp. DS7-9]